MNNFFRLSSNRYSELTEYIDKSAVKELEILFPKLVAEIFSTNSQVNWNLRTLKPDINYSLFHEVYNFLLPNGPMFRLCYKLLLDCHLRYEFPYQHLPDVVRQKLEDSGDTSFYKQKVVTRSKISIGNCIYLNAFECYLFHFSYHLIDPALQLPDENTLEWDTVYLRLVGAYLDYFVPCTSSLIYPLLNQSTSPVSTSQPALSSYSPTSKNAISIFREDVIKKMSPSPPPFTRTKTNSSAEIWRTELVTTLFFDFWFSSVKNESMKNSISFAGQKLWTVDVLPSKEQLRCIRIFLKHTHYFTNHILTEDCAMNDLKREILSNNRRAIYSFFHSAMTQLPLDSSYKLLLEGWLAYLQPWRYTDPYSKNMKLVEGHKDGIDRRWFSFVAENLIMYTHLYYIVLTRLSRCDLTTYKISSMSHRLLQVFSQARLLDYIREVENYLEEGQLGSINSWNSIIRQNIYSLEKAQFRYDFFYSTNRTQQVLEFITQIEENLPVLQLRRQKILMNDDVTFLKWLKEQLSGNILYSSTEELQKIESYLLQSLQKLYQIHKIPISDSNLGTSSCLNSSRKSLLSDSFNSVSSFDSTDGSVYSNQSLRVDPKEKKKAALSLKYEGDPDLYPIRSWENKFLVRVLYYLCLWINTQFQRDLKFLYYENSIRGGIFRQILCPPRITYYFEKHSSPDGYSRRVSTVLPPRVSLRWCASYYSNFLFLSVYLLLKFFQYSIFHFASSILFFYFVYLLISAIFFPTPILADENDSISGQ